MRHSREVYVRPVTVGREVPRSWPAEWLIRIAGLVVLGLLAYALVLLVLHLRIAGG